MGCSWVEVVCVRLKSKELREHVASGVRVDAEVRRQADAASDDLFRVA
jgi:hypothetical protein